MQRPFQTLSEAISRAIWDPKWSRKRCFLEAERRSKTVLDTMSRLQRFLDALEMQKLGFRTIGVQFLRVQPHVPKKPKIVQKWYKNGTKMERKCIQKSIRDHVQKRFAKKSVFEANMAPKRLPRWVLKPSLERPRWDKKPYEFVHFLEKRSRCHRDPSEDPFWSPNGAN